jgi:hypothetical protein
MRTNKEVKKIENSVLGTMKIEGMKPSVNGKNITNDFLKGNITSKEAVRKIKKYWGFEMNYKKTLLFDFDGVINSYTSGWKGIDVIPDEPVTGIKELISELREEYIIKIYSTRCLEEKGIKAIEEYLDKHNIVVDGITRTKEKAYLTIDDRAITFRGDCKTLVDEIKNFKVWNKK